MAQYSTLETAAKSDFPRIFEIMSNAFPKTEMRNYEGQASLFDHHFYKVLTERENNKIIGILAIWEFDDVNFIEHFAIDNQYRGKGIGSKMLIEYLEQSEKPVFLEVEPPTNDLAIRRIEFYKRLGFNLNMFEYYQPALQEGQRSIPLKIMTYPFAVDEEFFLKHKKIAHEVAYSAQFG